MHKILLFVVVLAGGLYAQDYNWEVLPNSPSAGRHDDIHFITPYTGWAVNTNGDVCKTTDGGNTWVIQANFSAYLRTVKFADSLTGWVSTLEGNDLLYQTSDGGITWSVVDNIPSPRPAGICGLYIIGDVIYGTGTYYGPASIIKSTNKGETWTSVDMSQYASTLVDCYFFTPDSGFVTGGISDSGPGHFDDNKAVLLFTSDGGSTWSVKYTGSEENEWGWKIYFPSRQTGYVSLEKYTTGNILKTTDGGNTWQKINIPGLEDLEGIGFINENHGWAAGRESEGFTTDGGLTWSTPGIETATQLNRFQFFGDSIGYAAGTRIYKYKKNSTVSVKESVQPVKSYLQSQNYPNPFNPTTTIEYTLPVSTNVRIRLYDGLGKEITTLYNSYQKAGKHSVIWNGTDGNGNSLSSGLYIYRIDTDKHSESKMMMLLK